MLTFWKRTYPIWLGLGILLALGFSYEEEEPVLESRTIQFGEVGGRIDNDGPLLTYIRFPQSGNFMDSILEDWAEGLYFSSRRRLLGTGQLNVQFDSHLVGQRYVSVIEIGTLTDDTRHEIEAIRHIFNFDLSAQQALTPKDIFDLSRADQLRQLLATVAGEVPDHWLDDAALTQAGVKFLLPDHEVVMPYETIMDYLLLEGLEGMLKTDNDDETASTKDFPLPDPNRPIIAFTFDDGPSAFTAAILDILKAHEARATFFLVGNLVESQADLVRRAYGEGHQILGHSWDHSNLAALPPAAIEAQITQTHQAIEDIIGPIPLLYRPPFGSFNDTVAAISEDLGFALVLWSVDTLDWQSRNADAIYRRFQEHRHDRAIVLFHDIFATTVDAVARLVPELVEEGYQFVTVSELLAISGIEPTPGTVIRGGPHN